MSEALTDADKERLHGIRNFLQGKDVPGVVRNLPHLDAVFLCRLIEELYTEVGTLKELAYLPDEDGNPSTGTWKSKAEALNELRKSLKIENERLRGMRPPAPPSIKEVM